VNGVATNGSTADFASDEDANAHHAASPIVGICRVNVAIPPTGRFAAVYCLLRQDFPPVDSRRVFPRIDSADLPPVLNASRTGI
jgi:hypothetical protein